MSDSILRALELRLALAAICLAAHTLPAFAALQCMLPSEIPTPRAVKSSLAKSVRREAIAGYTLALSWSPEYCAGRVREGAFQCASANRFGFVLHGLWPDGRGGSWPQYCRPAALLPRRVIAENLCMTPSAQLLQHEWAKHGSCMATRPEDYFAKARALYGELRLPDMAALARSDRLSAGALIDAVARLNSGLPRDAMRVRTTRHNRLSELWICLDTALRPTRCLASKKGVSLSAQLKVRPVD